MASLEKLRPKPEPHVWSLELTDREMRFIRWVVEAAYTKTPDLAREILNIYELKGLILDLREHENETTP